jgi:hypothetical protein
LTLPTFCIDVLGSLKEVFAKFGLLNVNKLIKRAYLNVSRDKYSKIVPFTQHKIKGLDQIVIRLGQLNDREMTKKIVGIGR